jgi:hypothetical protein
MPEHDPQPLQLYARRLYAKAHTVARGSLLAGVALGAAVGAVPLTGLGAAWPIPSSFGIATLLFGALCGGVIGYVIGDARAVVYRAEAQLVVSHLRTERFIAGFTQAVLQLHAAPQAPPPSSAQPAGEPVRRAAR